MRAEVCDILFWVSTFKGFQDPTHCVSMLLLSKPSGTNTWGWLLLYTSKWVWGLNCVYLDISVFHRARLLNTRSRPKLSCLANRGERKGHQTSWWEDRSCFTWWWLSWWTHIIRWQDLSSDSTWTRTRLSMGYTAQPKQSSETLFQAQCGVLMRTGLDFGGKNWSLISDYLCGQHNYILQRSSS